ncbi:hypothetical protein DRO59_00340 [Candidatus Bathyarchaeota archaeon]|nr:MAG: hypothetical protein DRO59_00340 [Candidatus Bathyarchaeota archaeon]
MEELRERIRVSSQGRIVIPQNIRKRLGIHKGTILEASIIKNKLILEVLVR